MKSNKIRSVKKASFYTMLKYGIIFVIINFLAVSVFSIFITYYLISNEESNMVNLVINQVDTKYKNVKNVSNQIAEIISDKYVYSENTKKILDSFVKNGNEVSGILILDSDGIIVETTEQYGSFKGYDYSNREYFIKAINQKKTIISQPFTSYETKDMTIAVVSPIIQSDKFDGLVVTLVDSNIIKDKDINGFNYYITNNNGDVIFNNASDQINFKDNILDSNLIKNIDSIGHKSRFNFENNRGLISIAKYDEKNDIYIMANYDIFNDKILINGLIIVFVLAISFVGIFLFLFSTKVSNTSTEYIDIFYNKLDKITEGNYDIELTQKYPYEEINNIIDKFVKMAKKVSQREQELQVYNEELRAANDDIRRMLITINKNEMDKKEQYIQIIGTMQKLIEIKDEYTAGHSLSVTEYSEQIAKKLNNDYGFNIDVEKIRVGAILHDIGKISIESNILNKPTRLTDEEYEIIKTHPNKGYYALKDIDNLNEEKNMVKYHHERYDGKGYPERIIGDAIPLGARIICVADSFDAMTSNRPYRKSLPIDFAKNELIKNKGTQFDSLIVDVFISILEEREKV